MSELEPVSEQADSRPQEARAAQGERAPRSVDVAAVGVVVIGRNEGDRLRRCLQSVVAAADRIVYVDSGSSDGSAASARKAGAAVVELDMRVPFAPGRARNEGFLRLLELHPALEYVQFVDGDCEVDSGWLVRAAAFLRAHADVAVVAGRRRERHPERSIYNFLCAMEWDLHPVGAAKACGGDALMRAQAFAAVGGFHRELMAGEEPELCERLRAAGWRVWFLDAPLTLHDAAMLKFSQWWKRAVRSGYGSMQRALLCAVPDDVLDARDLFSTWLWALLLPCAALVVALTRSPWAFTLLLPYPLLLIRVALGCNGTIHWRRRLQYAAFLLLAKLPKLVGQLGCLTNYCSRHAPRLIEYKSVERRS